MGICFTNIAVQPNHLLKNIFDNLIEICTVLLTIELPNAVITTLIICDLNCSR